MTQTLLNNRYQVIQVLGAGGFGETFLAEDTHMPSLRRCVIKQLKPISNDPQTYQIIQDRFKREAATLEHLGEASDQIPKLYAYFPENGQFYLVQEWIQGQTLTQMVEAKGYIAETTVREILLSLLSVLDYVHSKGIIHRDIKPDNIILRSHDNKPVLIDFGAVKETIRTVINPSGQPLQSLVIGTPGYMPSEQAIGRPVYATDIYSLALTAIYLLTGKQPQELETHPQTGQILWQQYAAGISPEMVKILTQAIEPRPSDRYSTASKMLYALKSAHSLNNKTYTSSPASQANIATISLSPPHVLSSATNPVIREIPNPIKQQKPAVIIGSLVAGSLIGAVAISSLIRPPQNTNSLPTNSSITRDNSTSATPTNSPATPQTQPTISDQQQTQPVNSNPSSENNSPQIFTPPIRNEAITPSNSTPINIPTFEPETQPRETTPKVVEDSDKDKKPQQQDKGKKKENSAENENNLSDTLSSNQTRFNVPAFPTGTSRSTVEATLGKNKDLRGVWGNTRAVTYKVVPKQIDLGYLFDRDTGRLRQTEVAFASSVDNQVMQTTLNSLLNGQATAEIKQGLQQIQQRQLDNFTFTQGAVKGQIVRQSCDFIYISIWDEELHDFVSPASAKEC
ncbi:serine/threonine-protein kinase [Anabaena sp. PCC 7108]|uniref:serine/threonine-protein kinase n=1 Tax=Anabaena sp. PCC 7108 TaxID=163908 RepID=UPI0003495FEE|nr:serine/threonine-protein kinase [Anabaena sp. PCC 7108]